jgi:hypothetical protein
MMYDDQWRSPYQGSQGTFDDWANGVLPGWEWLSRDPLAHARNFYGEAVMQSLIEAQRQQNEQLRIRTQRLPDMVDDVAAQWHSSWGDWP